MSRLVRTATIRGRRFKFRWEKPGCGDLGRCDNPRVSDPEIVVDPALAGFLRLEILVHECTHGAFWDLDEEAVAEFASDVAKLLVRDGWHRDEDDDIP